MTVCLMKTYRHPITGMLRFLNIGIRYLSLLVVHDNLKILTYFKYLALGVVFHYIWCYVTIVTSYFF